MTAPIGDDIVVTLADGTALAGPLETRLGPDSTPEVSITGWDDWAPLRRSGDDTYPDASSVAAALRAQLDESGSQRRDNNGNTIPLHL